ncbi:MFS transporter [Bacillus cereus]|uniref:MFS transporter n=1 Tax=Bacillus cereus TaxID=1396 RepID=UPI000B4BBBF1|nr:MFS transporter [Bacillus cereus]
MKTFDKYCSFTFFSYFATFAIVVPLTGLFLNQLHFGSKEIGIILGISILARILGPYVFLLISKLNRNLASIYLIQCVLLLVVLFVGTQVKNSLAIVIALSLLNIFWISILPNIETISLSKLNGDMKRYSTIRMWGSIGFIFFSVWASHALIKFGPLSFWFILIFLGFMLLISSILLIRLEPIEVTKKKSKSIFIERKLFLFYSVFFLFELTHAPYYGFFSIKLLENNYTGFAIGSLIAFAVICEIVTFAYGHRLLKYMNVSSILLLCSILGILRWTLIELFVGSITLLVISQLMHAFTFALYHICAMNILSLNADQDLISQRQTTYTVLTMGIGAALGAYLSGLFWDVKIFQFSSFISVGVSSLVISIILILLVMKKEANQALNNPTESNM